MADLELTMAVSHYDRNVPLFYGSIKTDGIDLRVLEVEQSNPLRNGLDTHERMLQKREFHVPEVSLSSYLMAKSHGMPVHGFLSCDLERPGGSLHVDRALSLTGRR